MGKGKKKDHKRPQKVSLAEFNGPQPTENIVKVAVDWNSMLSDDDEDQFMKFDMSNMPTAPKGPQEVPLDKVPDEPPFIAYMSGIPFTATEDKVVAFFTNSKVTRVEMSSEDGKNRGNATIEFEDKTSLINALRKSEDTMGSRVVRITLENPRDRFSNRTMGGDRGAPGTTASGIALPDDWRSNLKKRTTEVNPAGSAFNAFGSGGSLRGNRVSEIQSSARNGYRGRLSDGGSRTGGFSSFQRRGDGPLLPTQGGDSRSRMRYNPGFQQQDRSGGSSMFPRTNRADNNEYRSSSRNQQPSEPRSSTQSPASAGVKRIDSGALKAILTGETSQAPRSSSIFGNAKPVDTSSKMEALDSRIEHLKITDTSRPPSGANPADRPLSRQPYRSSRSEDFRSDTNRPRMSMVRNNFNQPGFGHQNMVNRDNRDDMLPGFQDRFGGESNFSSAGQNDTRPRQIRNAGRYNRARKEDVDFDADDDEANVNDRTNDEYGHEQLKNKPSGVYEASIDDEVLEMQSSVNRFDLLRTMNSDEERHHQ